MKKEAARELLEKFAKEYWNPMLLPEIEPSDINDFLSTLPDEKEESSDPYLDTEADGFVFCGKCGKLKEV